MGTERDAHDWELTVVLKKVAFLAKEAPDYIDKHGNRFYGWERYYPPSYDSPRLLVLTKSSLETNIEPSALVVVQDVQSRTFTFLKIDAVCVAPRRRVGYVTLN